MACSVTAQHNLLTTPHTGSSTWTHVTCVSALTAAAALLLSDAVHNLLEANKIVAATCESQSMHLYFQRNVLISGGR